MIDVPSVRLVGINGEMLGIVSIKEAQEVAFESGFDLVEVSPNADPPVCKILDYGKFKYEAQKQKTEARKKQKTITVKEIKMRPSIDRHDYDIKMKKVRQFLNDGDKVKMTIRFRGREMAYQDVGIAVLRRARDELSELAKVEYEPKVERRQMIMVLAPKSLSG